jgi:hypothetical protein
MIRNALRNPLKNAIANPIGDSGLYVPSFCRACWVFDSAGDKVIDLSQFGNTATNSGATFQGNKFYFDGSDDYMSVANSSSLDITSAPLAVFATINLHTSLAVDSRIISKNTSTTADTQYELRYVSSSKSISAILEGAGRGNTGTDSITLGQWTNIGFIWDGTNIKTFIKCVQKSTNSFSATLTSRTYINIGKAVGGSLFKGNIANVTIYAGTGFNTNETLDHQRMLSAPFGIAV